MTLIGFFTGYIADCPSPCTGEFVFGEEGITIFMLTFLVSSLIGLVVTGMIVSLLIQSQRTRKMNHTIHHSIEYRITKMFCTGMCHSVK